MCQNSKWLVLITLLCCLGQHQCQADCTLTNTAYVPLPESGFQLYQGYAGGLYPNGGNNRPPAHLAAGIALANQIAPLDSNGQVNTNTGRIVVLSIGMSNCTQEWASKGTNTFQAVANRDPAKNPRVAIVDGALGGQDAAAWTNQLGTNWTLTAMSRLTNSGYTAKQVQVIWMKDALKSPALFGSFPAHAQELQTDFEMMARNAKYWFPNLKLIYMASRTRAYTADASTLNPEPFAYESGFSVKWMLEKQINGDPALNYDPASGPVKTAWLSWGPYIWADGTDARSDGFTWLCPTDLESDYTHPSTNGVALVAEQVSAFFKTDPTAAPWYLKKTTPPFSLTVSADATNGIAPLTVSFSAAASPATNLSQILWTFDDGEFAAGQSPTKIFRSPGIYTARVTVSDKQGNNLTSSVNIHVNSTYAFWKSQKFSSTEATNSAISGLAADPDGDKLPNLLEYALGLEPKTPNGRLPSITTQNGLANLSFPHLKAAADVSLVLEASTDLVNWTSNFSQGPTIVDEGVIEKITFHDSLQANVARFYRLKASQ
jgi:hypothetical protein